MTSSLLQLRRNAQEQQNRLNEFGIKKLRNLSMQKMKTAKLSI